MWDQGTNPEFTQQVQLEIPIFAFRQMPFFGNIEKEEIGAVIQIIIEPMSLVKSDNCIYLVMIQFSFDMRILVGKDVLRMVEVDLESQPLILVEQKTQPVIILRNGKRL